MLFSFSLLSTSLCGSGVDCFFFLLLIALVTIVHPVFAPLKKHGKQEKQGEKEKRRNSGFLRFLVTLFQVSCRWVSRFVFHFSVSNAVPHLSLFQMLTCLRLSFFLPVGLGLSNVHAPCSFSYIFSDLNRWKKKHHRFLFSVTFSYSQNICLPS